MPPDECTDLQAAARGVSYGWGTIPVSVQIGRTEWTTSLFPKDGRHVVPVKADVRKAEGLDEGDTVRRGSTKATRSRYDWRSTTDTNDHEVPKARS